MKLYLTHILDDWFSEDHANQYSLSGKSSASRGVRRNPTIKSMLLPPLFAHGAGEEDVDDNDHTLHFKYSVIDKSYKMNALVFSLKTYHIS